MCNVVQEYGWAPQSERAIDVDDGELTGDGVMFMAAMSAAGVLPITLPVVEPLTVTGFIFEFWCL
jgi:hypothetical protein